MKSNKTENETTNRQNDDQLAQLADLPVNDAQETDVRGGGDLKASGDTAPQMTSVYKKTLTFTLSTTTP